MAKDIEQILDDLVVPEMEYEPKYDVGKTKSKKKKDARSTVVTVDQVPEVVLPKTKAEVYREAKGRLTAKTAAVSRTSDKVRVPKTAEPETVELEIAAVTQNTARIKTRAASRTAERTVTRTTERTTTRTAERSATRIGESKRRTEQRVAPATDGAWVGSPDELVPFAWRMPLVAELSRPNKIYKQVVRTTQSFMLPAPSDKNV